MNLFGMVPFHGDALGDRTFRADPSHRQTPPTEKCNPAWDPGCPRPLPQMTMVPYVPSSYLQGPEASAPAVPSYMQGPEIIYSRSEARPRPRDRSGRVY